MHRVYNSAFMHMLRDEDNAGYRKVIRDTLEFDPGDPRALRELPDEPRRGDRDRAVRDRRQVLRGGDAARDAARPADDRPRPGRGLHREVRDGVPAGPPRRGSRTAGSSSTSSGEIVPLLRERRRFAGLGRLPPVRRRRPTAARSSRTSSPTRTGAARTARWSSTTTGSRRRGGWIRDSVPFARRATTDRRPRPRDARRGARR